MKDKVIFSDLDGTLCFHEEIHGIKKIETKVNKLVKVEDPASKTQHLAYDVSTSLYNVFFGVETKGLCRALQNNSEFIFVTGARKSSIECRLKFMNFADGYILENGGLILDRDFNIDKGWYDLLDPERAYLKDTQKYLESKGWKLDFEGRTSALRVRLKDNPHRSQEQFQELSQNLELPEQLKKTMNVGSLDIILRSAGKDKAVGFVRNNMWYNPDQAIGIGDDLNDILMLEQTGHKYVLASSYPEILKVAKKRRWYISKGKHFNGINEILRDIKDKLY